MIGKRVAPGRAEESMWIFEGGALAFLGGGRAVICHKPKCLSILLMNSGSSMNAIYSSGPGTWDGLWGLPCKFFE